MTAPQLYFASDIAFVFGAFVGSFLNVVAVRVVRGESIVRPRSHCLSCSTVLSPLELVPILSWLLLRGRCRHCQSPIPIRYPVVELTTGLLWALTVLRVPVGAQWLAWAVFWALLTTLVATDLTVMRVPNILSLPGACTVMVLSIVCGVHTWWGTLFGAAEAALVLFVVHLLSRGGMGMGDVKLYISVGAMLGGLPSIESLVVASLSGAVVGLSMRAVGWMRPREHMPFVPHILVGVVVIAFLGPTLTHWYLVHLLHVQP